MTAIIFFGGLVTGFVIAWLVVALLIMASFKNRQKDEVASSSCEPSQLQF